MANVCYKNIYMLMLILRILIAISMVAELISLGKNRNGVEGCVEYERSEGMIMF